MGSVGVSAIDTQQCRTGKNLKPGGSTNDGDPTLDGESNLAPLGDALHHGVLAHADANQVAAQDLDAVVQGVFVQVVGARLGGLEHEALDLEGELERLGAPVGVLRYVVEHVVRLVVAQHALDHDHVVGAQAAQLVVAVEAPVAGRGHGGGTTALLFSGKRWKPGRPGRLIMLVDAVVTE